MSAVVFGCFLLDNCLLWEYPAHNQNRSEDTIWLADEIVCPIDMYVT